MSAHIEAGASEAELAARAERRLGEVLRGKYQLNRVLGVGGMATVYAATHRNGRDVALKLLHPQFALLDDIRGRFLREGYVANNVKHAGAVTVLDDDVTEDGEAFLVMELLSGVTVQDLWESRGHKVHPAWVTAILLQVLDVIEAAHDKGIIHRDLKPANLFVTHAGEVKVLDFGIARMRARTPEARTTNFGALLGTPAFMAPEQALGRTKEVDETTDLWALASVAFALLVGDVVHPAENTQETLIFAATRPARPVGPLTPDTPPAIAAVLDRALSFERANRWPSASAMRTALAEAARSAYGDIAPVAVLAEALSGASNVRRSNGFEATVDASSDPALPAASAGVAGVVEAPVVLPPVPVQAGAANDVESPMRSLVGGLSITSSGKDRPLDPESVPVLVAPPQRRRVLWGAAVVGVGLVLLPWLHGNAQATADATMPTVSAGHAQLVADPPPAAPDDEEAEPAAAPPTPPPAPPPAPPSPVASVAHASSRPLPSASAAPAKSASATAATARSSCTPPFFIDRATGRKKWKLECL